MACEVCKIQSENFACQFSLDAALENIRKHYKSMETTLQVKTKSISELTEHNKKLMKAIDCLKKPETLSRLNSFSEQFQPEPLITSNNLRVPSPIFEDITILDDEEEDNALVSVMDVALNGSALNTTLNNEIIAETEHINTHSRGPHIRRLALKSRSKTINTKKSNNNDENEKPILTSPPIASQISPTTTTTEVKQKETKANISKSNVRRLSLRQTRLPFDEKRERCQNAESIPKRTLTLRKMKKTQEAALDLDDDVFNFDKSVTFQFKSPTPKKSKTNFLTSPKIEDQSVIAIGSPTQTVIFLDETTFDENFENQRPEPKISPLARELSEESTDSMADFDMSEISPKKIKRRISKQSQRSIANKKPSPPIQRIKEEPISQSKSKKPINPVFGETENTEEESEDDLLPIQVKSETEAKKRIDIDGINCADCRNYIKFCGERMTREKLEAHIRNCVYHNEPKDIEGGTPEGFWNPLLLSFATNDPRNEVLIDNRFAGKKTGTSGNRKNT